MDDYDVKAKKVGSVGLGNFFIDGQTYLHFWSKLKYVFRENYSQKAHAGGRARKQSEHGRRQDFDLKLAD